MFDANILVGGVSLMALVFGLTEFIKDLIGWTGKKVTALAAGLGLVLYGIAEALAYVPEPYNAIVVAVFGSLAFGLAASGFYKFSVKNGS
jgi:hypothetical protein